MKPFTTLAVIVFLLVALAHLYRLIAGFEIIIAGQAVPQWASAAGLVAAGVLSLMVWRESRP